MDIVKPNQDLVRSPTEVFRKQNSTCYDFVLLSWAAGGLLFPVFLGPEEGSVLAWGPSPP